MRARSAGLLLSLTALHVACSSFDAETTAPPAGDAGVGAAEAGGDAGGDAEAGSAACAPAAGELAFTEPASKPVDLARAAATTGPAFDLSHGSKACPISLKSEQTPRWATVVLNATGRPAQIEAWGACAESSHEVNVVAYRRATPPATTVELADCAQASVGFEGNSSESSAGSGWCKGLLAKDGQAVALAPCERAVVVFEFGSDSTVKPPPTGTVRLGLR